MTSPGMGVEEYSQNANLELAVALPTCNIKSLESLNASAKKAIWFHAAVLKPAHLDRGWAHHEQTLITGSSLITHGIV